MMKSNGEGNFKCADGGGGVFFPHPLGSLSTSWWWKEEMAGYNKLYKQEYRLIAPQCAPSALEVNFHRTYHKYFIKQYL
jgi:hypothetical protein